MAEPWGKLTVPPVVWHPVPGVALDGFGSGEVTFEGPYEPPPPPLVVTVRGTPADHEEALRMADEALAAHFGEMAQRVLMNGRCEVQVIYDPRPLENGK